MCMRWCVALTWDKIIYFEVGVVGELCTSSLLQSQLKTIDPSRMTLLCYHSPCWSTYGHVKNYIRAAQTCAMKRVHSLHVRILQHVRPLTSL